MYQSSSKILLQAHLKRNINVQNNNIKYFQFFLILLFGIWMGTQLVAIMHSQHITSSSNNIFQYPTTINNIIKPLESLQNIIHPFNNNNNNNNNGYQSFSQQSLLGLSTYSDTSESKKSRLLFMTAVYTFDQFLFLQKVLDCMRDHCNSGWNVTIHLQVANGLNYSHPRYTELQDRLYCFATNKNIPLIIETYEKIGFGLNSRHRKYVKDHLNEFDYFSFAEEDMLLTVSHLNSYLSSVKVLQDEFPKTWKSYYIGFVRWEDSLLEDSERVSWEYLPHQIHAVKIKNNLPPYIVTNNLNQAIYILSRDHIHNLQDKCQFLTDIGQNKFYSELRKAQNLDWKFMSVGVSEWSSSFQHILQCGMKRVIPIDHFQNFMIQHSSNKAQVRRPRKELLNARDWMELVKNKSKHPISLNEAYNKIIFKQYNLDLINVDKFSNYSNWTWDLDIEF